MAKFNPFQFLQEVRQETNKVTWKALRLRPRRLAGVEGLEPPTPGFGDRCSSH